LPKTALRRSRKPLNPRRTRAARRPAQSITQIEESPRAKELAHRIANHLIDKKASDVLILDVRGKTSYADYFVIASGDSERQVSAMGEHVTTQLGEGGTRPLGVEGFETGRWVLLDFIEVVVHLFFNEVRTFYDLEGLWTDAPREKVA
jgi:ribosome-associated protein